MKNIILDRFNNTINIKVHGRNIDRFIKKLYKSKIEILNLNIIDRNTVIIKVNLIDHDKVLKLKSIYEVDDIGYNGLIKFKKYLYRNRFLFFSLIIGYFIILFLSNIIFEVQIVHSNKEIRNLINKELINYDIKKYSFKKNYKKLSSITTKILKDNKDTIEWMSIENVGTKVIVKVEERKLNSDVITYPKQNIIATRSGIIRKVEAKNGVIIRNVNDYVTKGDVVISGEIMDTYGEKLMDTVSAIGKVYAEVWYTVDLEYPLIYKKEEKTGKVKNVYELQIFSKKFSLFDFNKYENSVDKEKVIFKNSILPIKLLKTKKEEVNISDDVLLLEEGLIEAEKAAREKILEKLDNDEYIIDEKKLSFYQKDSKIVAEIFFSVYENIGAPEEIIETDTENIESKKEEEW